MKILKSNRIPSALLTGAISVLLLIFSGCSTSSEKKDYAIVGGEIINPTSNYVVFKNEGRILDTVPLDQRNKFSYRIDSVQTGLYLIQHRPETQNIYLEPGDSVLLRANTLAFDESLHFSGKGAEKNNFMAEMYLLDASNADLLLSFYKTDPGKFLEKTDSIRGERLRALEKAAAKHKFSKDFVELADDIIDYESYDLLERYTYLVNKYYKEYSKKFPKEFHNYRKQVRFNEASIQCSPGYRRFIDNYLINRSFKWCAKQAFDTHDCYSLTDAENIKSRIRMVGDLIRLSHLRHHFLSKLGSLGIVMAENREEILEIISLLEEKGYPEEGIEDMKQLGSIQLAYLPGSSVNNVQLINNEGNSIPAKEIIQKPTIIFLWSIYNERHISDHELIQEFRKKYPEINFIGVNMDVGEVSAWRLAVQKYGYKKENEYQLGSTGIDRRFFEYYLNKLLFLDSSGKVIIGDAFISSPDFENRILEFLNQ